MKPRVRVQLNERCFFNFFAESLNFAILTHVSNPSILPRHVAHTPSRTPSPGAADARENADNSIARTIFFLHFVFLLEPFPVLRVFFLKSYRRSWVHPRSFSKGCCCSSSCFPGLVFSFLCLPCWSSFQFCTNLARPTYFALDQGAFVMPTLH